MRSCRCNADVIFAPIEEKLAENHPLLQRMMKIRKKDDEGADEKQIFGKDVVFHPKDAGTKPEAPDFGICLFRRTVEPYLRRIRKRRHKLQQPQRLLMWIPKTLDELEEQCNKAIDTYFNGAELNDSSHDSCIPHARHFDEPDSRPRKRFRIDPLVQETTSEYTPFLRSTTDPDEMMMLSQIPLIKKFPPSTKLQFQVEYLKLVQTFKG
ncbi:hypothetical protein CEXT_425591 [Caerostris extrusa]|uniref:BESS domain-containing protein n=1 Tax=Caerostris extrusa TaxID=172846 RepID=A0AAV4WIW7_CAEEX|nr:hypothetical protein CEXT_425591 [Caerostris extrusa]